MANITLAPEDDDFDFFLALDYLSFPSKNAKVSKSGIEVQGIRSSLGSRKSGGGLIVPWPGLDHVHDVDEADDIDILDDGQEQARAR
jgi:hypothetical protein